MSRSVLLCVFLLLISAAAQIAPIPPGTQAPPEVSPHRFDWNWRRSQELSWRQSIGKTQNLSRTERDRLLAAITHQLSDYDFQSEEDQNKAPMEARIKYVVLGSGSDQEVIVQAGDRTSCSPTGNCAFWILRRQGDSYAPLLRAEAQTFTLQRTRNLGFLDIVLTRHDSAFQSEVRVYKFDGESYKEAGCYWAEWQQVGEDGEYHKLEDPKITICGAR